jgi:hypothetical protein
LKGLAGDDQKSGAQAASKLMSAYSDHSTVGGQVLAHRFRMTMQNWRLVGTVGKFAWLFSFLETISKKSSRTLFKITNSPAPQKSTERTKRFLFHKNTMKRYS